MTRSIGNFEPPAKKLREFGWIVGGVFLAIGSWPLFKGAGPRLWALAMGTPLVALAAISPAQLKLPFLGWMYLGEGLGWINSRIILSLFFYLILAPVGFLRRLLGKSREFGQFDPTLATYAEPVSPRDNNHFERQF